MKWALMIVLCSCAGTPPAVVVAPMPATAPASDVIFAVPAGQCSPPIDVGMSFAALRDLLVACEEQKRPLGVELAKERTSREIAETERDEMVKRAASLKWRADWVPWITGGAGLIVGGVIAGIISTLKPSLVLAH